MKVIDPKAKLAQISEYWNPHIIAELNGQQVKLAKLKGKFVWHSHAEEDELFMVLKGRLHLEFRDRTIELESGQLAVVPRGVEHRPVAEEEVHLLLFEPASTINTGNAESELTRSDLKRI